MYTVIKGYRYRFSRLQCTVHISILSCRLVTATWAWPASVTNNPPGKLHTTCPEAEFFEVSSHNLESSQTWGFCMFFLNHKEWGRGFYQVILLSPLQCTITAVTHCRNCKRLREFEEIESQGKAVEVTVNSKEENS
jgi:hypothetical protein